MYIHIHIYIDYMYCTHYILYNIYILYICIYTHTHLYNRREKKNTVILNSLLSFTEEESWYLEELFFKHKIFIFSNMVIDILKADY